MVLSQIGRRLQDVGGDRGVVARLGGNEFVVYLADAATRQQAERVAAAVALSMAERPGCLVRTSRSNPALDRTAWRRR